MKHFYSLYDSKACIYTPPFLAENDETAARVVIDAFEHLGECNLTRYPEDYTLFLLGTWDEDEGKLVGATPLAVANVLGIISVERKRQAVLRAELSESGQPESDAAECE